MSIRRIAVLALTLATLLGAAALGRGAQAVPARVFTELVAPKTPFVPLGNQVASTFFCPGMPTEGDAVEASVVVANPLDTAIAGEVNVLVGVGTPLQIPFEIGGRSSQAFDIAAQVDTPYAGVLVEVAGGGTVVQQRVSTPAGSAVAACSNDASAEWYFADGSTLDGMTYQLLLSNPFQDTAVVSLAFATTSGPRTPTHLGHLVIPPGTIRVIPIDEIGAKDEELLSIAATSNRGRFVAAKSQSFTGGSRRGYVLALGSPSAGDQWYFADGERGTDIVEQIVLFNPTAEDVEVDLLPIPEAPVPNAFVETASVVVPARRSIVVDPTTEMGGLPEGPYALVASTLSSESIIAERVLTRPAGDSRTTSVMLGSRYGSSRWWLADGVPEPTEGALVVQNVTREAGTITVSYVGPGGLVALGGLDEVAIAPGAVLRLDLTATEAAGKPVVVASTTLQLIVEQRFPRVSGSGLAAALAVPE